MGPVTALFLFERAFRKPVFGICLTQGYGVMHRWRKMPDGTQVLLVGPDNFPFPIPLKKNDGGQWFFDTAAGRK
jgi:hypothetical protein